MLLSKFCSLSVCACVWLWAFWCVPLVDVGLMLSRSHYDSHQCFKACGQSAHHVALLFPRWVDSSHFLIISVHFTRVALFSITITERCSSPMMLSDCLLFTSVALALEILNLKPRTRVVAQWLRIHWQCGRHRSEPWSGKLLLSGEQLSPWPTITKPMHTAAEAQAPGAGALGQEKPPQWEARAPQAKSSPRWSRLGKAQEGRADTVPPKRKERNKSWRLHFKPALTSTGCWRTLNSEGPQ